MKANGTRIDDLPTDRLVQKAYDEVDRLLDNYAREYGVAGYLAWCICIRVPETNRDEIIKMLEGIGTTGATEAAKRIRRLMPDADAIS